MIGGASAGVEKDPGSLGFARDDKKTALNDTKNRRDYEVLVDAGNLTPNPFPSGKGNRIVGSNLFRNGKGNRIYVGESKRASSPFCD